MIRQLLHPRHQFLVRCYKQSFPLRMLGPLCVQLDLKLCLPLACFIPFPFLQMGDKEIERELRGVVRVNGRGACLHSRARREQL